MWTTDLSGMNLEAGQPQPEDDPKVSCSAHSHLLVSRVLLFDVDIDSGTACPSGALVRETVVSQGGYMVLFRGDRGVYIREYDIDAAGK